MKQLLRLTQNSFHRQLTGIIFLVATIATIGSLYLSLGLGLVPCELCWYQRILMYPLPIISAFSFYKNELFSPLFAFFSGLGIIISYYHSFLQFVPEASIGCSSLCAATLYTVGPLTIPNLSAIAFTVIFATVLFHTYRLENKSFSF